MQFFTLKASWEDPIPTSVIPKVKNASIEIIIVLIRPPVYGSNGRTYKMLVMFFSFFLFFATRSPSSLDRSP